eukprot:TRINITY_DN12863_c0_g1_i1.p1 TRINITY_DN12863_c0_g1~~TRINITY_DN12863_c0_g1_i1.p1  ORF type:complete len:146 (-),score=35.65 TRINITY_DN12863_c0_g1_i1:137-574(-)
MAQQVRRKQQAQIVAANEELRKESLKEEYSYLPANSFDSPNKQSWLTKQGGIYKTWKMRYFVLDGTNLFYYRSETADAPRGVINLDGCEIYKDLTKGKSNCFQISHPKRRSFYIFAKTVEEMAEWIKEINIVIKQQENKTKDTEK